MSMKFLKYYLFLIYFHSTFLGAAFYQDTNGVLVGPIQDIDGNGSVDLFRDIKDSHNGYYALRWEWNGSKFIPKF